MTKRALLTGASGFVGRRLVNALLAEGWRVSIMSRPQAVVPTEWAGQVTRIDIRDFSEEALSEALTQCRFDVLVHLAAYGTVPTDRNPRKIQEVNVDWPATLVRISAKRGAGIVMTGSSAEYAPPEANVPVIESASLETGKLYGSSKAAGSLLSTATAVALNVPFRLLRLFNVYGPGEAAHRLLPCIIGARETRTIVPLSVGSQIRDFVHVDDAVSALTMSMEHLLRITHADVRIWNVATGVGNSVRQFAIEATNCAGVAHKQLRFGEIPMRPDEIPYLVGSPGLIKQELGWHPTYDLNQGIAASILEISEKTDSATG